MQARDGDIIRYFNIHVFLASDIDDWLVPESDELEDASLFLCPFLHDLDDQVGLLRFGDVDGVELFVVQVDAVLVEGLAHLATQRLPVDGHAEVVGNSLDLLGEPLLETEQVDVPHRTQTLARSDERVGDQPRLETDPAGLPLARLHPDRRR